MCGGKAPAHEVLQGHRGCGASGWLRTVGARQPTTRCILTSTTGESRCEPPGWRAGHDSSVMCDNPTSAIVRSGETSGDCRHRHGAGGGGRIVSCTAPQPSPRSVGRLSRTREVPVCQNSTASCLTGLPRRPAISSRASGSALRSLPRRRVSLVTGRPPAPQPASVHSPQS